MRVLILSQYPWKKDNSFGNTYSNIFGKIDNIEIAHIYLMSGTPDKENVITRYYQIPEGEVFKSFTMPWKKTVGAGHIVKADESKINEMKPCNPPSPSPKRSIYSKLLGIGKRHHWSIMFLVRELAWKYGKINYEGMMAFVEDFKPDIFFLPFHNTFFTNRLAMYIKRHYDVPLVSYMAMDHYSWKRVSFNPLFWIDRFFKRSLIRELSKELEVFYCISDKLKEELESSLNITCKVLYKIPELERKTEPYTRIQRPVRFLFTGNIYANRWKTLSYLAKALCDTQYGRLDIYTASPITKQIEKALNIDGYSELHPPVSPKDVIDLQNGADVLVHVESFDLKNRLLVRCAISTKIMDYLSVGRCILAIGPKDIASIEYLAGDDLALVANSENELLTLVEQINENPQILLDYSNKGLAFINERMNPTILRDDLYNDLEQYIVNYKTNRYNNNESVNS